MAENCQMFHGIHCSIESNKEIHYYEKSIFVIIKMEGVSCKVLLNC